MIHFLYLCCKTALPNSNKIIALLVKVSDYFVIPYFVSAHNFKNILPFLLCTSAVI